LNYLPYTLYSNNIPRNEVVGVIFESKIIRVGEFKIKRNQLVGFIFDSKITIDKVPTKCYLELQEPAICLAESIIIRNRV
jgi:hypothetical protein